MNPSVDTTEPKAAYQPGRGPSINLIHKDGPLLTCTDGTQHVLYNVDLMDLNAGVTSLQKLNSDYSNLGQKNS